MCLDGLERYVEGNTNIANMCHQVESGLVVSNRSQRKEKWFKCNSAFPHM